MGRKRLFVKDKRAECSGVVISSQSHAENSDGHEKRNHVANVSNVNTSAIHEASRALWSCAPLACKCRDQTHAHRFHFGNPYDPSRSCIYRNVRLTAQHWRVAGASGILSGRKKTLGRLQPMLRGISSREGCHENSPTFQGSGCAPGNQGHPRRDG